ncbi:MAG TPA: hypothetical protein VGQ30_08955 [Gemmatimonadaceae bacterium]|jgi:hypothetical protein|nr:hypothetical protein [Gemmatimonadaceae bacterium]
MSRNARRTGFGLAVTGLVGIVFRHGIFDNPFLKITLPGGREILLTVMQSASVLFVPIGLIIGITGFILHRRYMRAAISDPVIAGIFDPTVEWPK